MFAAVLLSLSVNLGTPRTVAGPFPVWFSDGSQLAAVKQSDGYLLAWIGKRSSHEGGVFFASVKEGGGPTPPRALPSTNPISIDADGNGDTSLVAWLDSRELTDLLMAQRFDGHGEPADVVPSTLNRFANSLGPDVAVRWDGYDFLVGSAAGVTVVPRWGGFGATYALTKSTDTVVRSGLASTNNSVIAFLLLQPPPICEGPGRVLCVRPPLVFEPREIDSTGLVPFFPPRGFPIDAFVHTAAFSVARSGQFTLIAWKQKESRTPQLASYDATASRARMSVLPSTGSERPGVMRVVFDGTAALVVWEDDVQPGRSVIRGVLVDADAQPIGDPMVLSAAGDNARSPYLLKVSPQRILLLYEALDGGQARIVAREIDSGPMRRRAVRR